MAFSSNNLFGTVANRLLLVANVLSTLNIENLIVPEVVPVDAEDALLHCIYSGDAAVAEDIVVKWLFNGILVYEWNLKTEPSAIGILKDRLDLSYRPNLLPNQRRHTLRIIHLTPELSGNYTCVIRSHDQETQQTKSMIVFSPEREFLLTFIGDQVKCMANRLYPRPDLTLEYNKIPIAQQQRVWRQGSFFEAECTAALSLDNIAGQGELACRLQIPQADYTAIVKKYLNTEANTANQLKSLNIMCYISMLFIFLFSTRENA